MYIRPYPFTGTNFKLHKASVSLLGGAIMLIAASFGYLYGQYSAEVAPGIWQMLVGSGVTLLLVWIFQIMSFNDTEVARRIHQLEQMESVLIQTVIKIDLESKLTTEQKRVVLDKYIEELCEVDWNIAEKHLQGGGLDQSGAVAQILEDLRKEKAASLKKKLEEDGVIPYAETDSLNEQSEKYRLMLMAIRTPK